MLKVQPSENLLSSYVSPIENKSFLFGKERENPLLKIANIRSLGEDEVIPLRARIIRALEKEEMSTSCPLQKIRSRYVTRLRSGINLSRKKLLRVVLMQLNLAYKAREIRENFNIDPYALSRALALGRRGVLPGGVLKKHGSVTLVKEGKCLDLLSLTYTNRPDEKIKESQMEAIHSYVVQNRKYWKECARCQNMSIFCSAKETKLARSLEFTSKGRVRIHLNKKKENDRCIKKSDEEVTTLAMDLESKEWFFSKSVKMANLKGEESELEEGAEFFIYDSKKTEEKKVRFLTPYVQNS